MDVRILPKDTIVYRSYNDESSKNGYWFSFDPTNTYGYGRITGEFRLIKDLTLINIAHENFYENLKNILKQATDFNENLKIIHPNILFPIGFDDSLFYRDFVKSAGFDFTNIPLAPHVHTESLLYFNNRSRLSIKKYDIEFMNFLNSLLGNICDGIISEKKFPDKIRNGYQHPEVGLFNSANMEYIKEHIRPTQGGSYISNDLLLAPINDQYLSEKAKEDLRLTNKILKEFKPPEKLIQNIIQNYIKIDNTSRINTVKGGSKNNNIKFRKTYKKKNK
jgi:hypothetical protein